MPLVIFRALDVCLEMTASQKSSEFVKRMFAEYYQKMYEPSPPTCIEKREFGFLSFNEQSMLRHVGFKSSDDLKIFVEEMAPSNVYYSCAYYEQPEVEMDRKGWLGADLIFDIDADHILTPCNKVHDEWVCVGCGFVGRGFTPEKCPACDCQKFTSRTWLCKDCLDSAKAETTKLLDILTQDFGFSDKEIHVFFSGNRGYHVHVENEAFKTADTISRKEIADYVCGLGFDMAFHGLDEKDWRIRQVSKSLNPNSLGWQGRMVKSMRNLVLNAKKEDYKALGLSSNVAATLIKNKESILKIFDDAGRLNTIKGLGFETWKRMAEFCAASWSAKIDTVVTTDVHRLIRLANTLHGKTAFKVAECPLSNIEDFDPFKAAVAFKKGTVLVFVSDSPEFKLGEETFGPYKKQKVELPTAAAMLLLCKGRAEVVE